MVVLNDICEECNYTCNTIYFQRNFKNWTCGNNDIDKFIQDAQLSTHNHQEFKKGVDLHNKYACEKSRRSTTPTVVCEYEKITHLFN